MTDPHPTAMPRKPRLPGTAALIAAWLTLAAYLVSTPSQWGATWAVSGVAIILGVYLATLGAAKMLLSRFGGRR